VAEEMKDAQAIALWMRNSVSENKVLVPNDLDLENSIRLAVNYVVAARSANSVDDSLNANEMRRFKWNGAQGGKYFDKCNQYFMNGPTYYAVIGASKGGVVKIFDKEKKRLLYEDSGYRGHIDGEAVTTQRWQNASCQLGENTFECYLKLFRVSENRMNVRKFFFLRVISSLINKSRYLRDKFKTLLARRLIVNKDEIKGCELIRRFGFAKDRIVIKDEIINSKPEVIVSLTTGRNFNPIHMASASYYSHTHLQSMANITLDNSATSAGIEVSIQ